MRSLPGSRLYHTRPALALALAVIQGMDTDAALKLAGCGKPSLARDAGEGFDLYDAVLWRGPRKTYRGRIVYIGQHIRVSYYDPARGKMINTISSADRLTKIEEEAAA